MTGDYSFRLNDCDVADKGKLQSFRDKRTLWLFWLDDDEHHAIWNVLSAMAWADVSFATISRLALDDPTGPLNSVILGEALIDGHIATQVLALRRLMDRGPDIISLPRLITDVKKSWTLLTREHFVCFDGLPYDYEAVAARKWAGRLSSGPTWLPTSGPNAYAMSQLMHEQFDRLAGIAPTQRTRQDLIPRSVIDIIEGWLKTSGAEEIAKWSSTYLAHAGGAERRNKVANVVVTNNKITDATKALARVAEAMSNVIFAGGRCGGGLMPAPQFDVFERLERPILKAGATEDAERIWEERTEDWDHCLDEVRDLLRKQVTLNR